jgi:beta-glucanase (GH16 family)
MRLLFICLLASSTLFGQLQPILWHVKTDTIERWDYHFGDEFSTATLDSEKWFDTYSWGGLLTQYRIYSDPKLVVPHEGFVSLKADTTSEWRTFPEWMIDKEGAKKAGVEIKNNSLQLKYLNSCIWSKQEFKYGYFECRCKAPSGKGLWPAFWLYGQNQKDEIDFMEMKGEKEFETHVDVHVPNTTDKVPGFLGFKQDWGGWIKTEQKLTDEWVIFSGIWKPRSLIYYVNGVPVSHFKGDFETSMNLIANLANAVDNGPFKPGPDEKTVFPNEFLVDYIRVWKSNENPSNVNIKKVNVRDENKVMSSAVIPSIKIKKKIGLIYDTKLFKKEIGFVALVPVGDRSYQIQANGVKLKNAKIQIIDASGTIIKETIVNTQFTNLNLSTLKKGDYTIQLQYNKIKQSIQLKL